MKVLNTEQLASYRQRGYLAPVDALSADETARARRSLEAVERAHGGQWPRSVSHKPHLAFTWLDALVRHPAILDVVEDIVGPDILCWSSRLFIKDPGDGGFVSWHQDLPYWGLDISDSIVSVWLALSPATRANGVMKVIPGSHRKLVRHRDAVASNLLRKGQEVAVAVDESQAAYMELGAGQMSLHHGLLFHGSEENHSTERRIGYAIRYLPTGVASLDGLPRDTASLVRGTDRHAHFDLLPQPAGDMHPAALEVQREAARRSDRIRDLAVEKHLLMTAATAA